jgi:uncharacterized protein YjdB
VIIANDHPICVRDTNQLRGTPALGGGSPITGASWKSLDEAIATVDPNTGLVTGISEGTVTIRYTVISSEGCVDSNDVMITVKRLPVLTITNNSICIGTHTQLMSDDTLAGGTWTSLDPGIATVDPNTGVVTGVGIGSARFIYSSPNGCSDTTGTVTVGTFPAITPITATPSTQSAVCSTTGNIQLECSTSGGEWTLSNPSYATLSGSSPHMSNPITVSGQPAGAGQKVFVTYTVGTGTCQSKSTYMLKIVDTSTPPTIIIGIER